MSDNKTQALPDGTGSRASTEPLSGVSAVPASIPSAALYEEQMAEVAKVDAILAGLCEELNACPATPRGYREAARSPPLPPNRRMKTMASEPELENVLKDPAAVLVNMLRGSIAKPSPRAIWHIYGRDLLEAMPQDFRHPDPTPLVEALRPFAACVDQISDDEDDEEWAKFRLLIKDYRRAADALTQWEKTNG